MIGRLDRLLTLYAMGRLCRRSAASPDIPILMYHSISEEDSGRSAYFQTATPPRVFAEHMALLRRNGYESIHLSDLAEAIKNDGARRRLVVLTFDDGYADFLTGAFPALSEYGYTATMFLPTAHIGEARRSFKDRECLTWTEVRGLSGAGIEFGSHTVTHPQLHDLPERAIREEVGLSKKVIEDELGREISCFAYPFAFPQTDRRFVGMLRSVLQDAGYRQGVCTTIGLVNADSDALFLERIPINGCDDPQLFEAKVYGAYNWMGWAQRVKQRWGAIPGVGHEKAEPFTDTQIMTQKRKS